MLGPAPIEQENEAGIRLVQLRLLDIANPIHPMKMKSAAAFAGPDVRSPRGQKTHRATRVDGLGRCAHE